ncbi:MAG: hypothetical protein HW386_2216 [Gammaproteobacteria bacterium]|nr:hypothetical protein [Gammaproteobacteria bacterium]
MPKLHHLLIAISVLIVLSLPGCALSPQTITVVPKLSGTGIGAATTAKRISIQVRDGRANTIVGYRGGIYSTAAITTADDLTGSIAREVTLAYSRSGYQVTEADADIRLVIDIETLDYKAQQNNIIWDIEFSAAIRATATGGAGEKTLQLQDRVTRQFAKAPSPQENENLINDVISKLLQRLVENNEFLTL